MSTSRANQLLWISLLGPPQVTWASTSLPIARRQTRALLYRLAVHLSPVPRTQLGYLFWPDIPDTTARRNLTHLLTLLRQAMPRPDLLLTDGETVAFHPQHVASDADTFACLTSTADAQARPSALAQALDLYRGSFLHAPCPCGRTGALRGRALHTGARRPRRGARSACGTDRRPSRT